MERRRLISCHSAAAWCGVWWDKSACEWNDRSDARGQVSAAGCINRESTEISVKSCACLGSRPRCKGANKFWTLATA
ncbi:uncharacterized protein BDW47DRAFT_105558 [Aspergillus candidus]|uniref:Uncharacterized protein n=1 Tax=Aspergillus candidus TaxID=41067 RepID=A0A2I2FC83_ASPCN|nr:hypothetical protein BDW47DRAFT_105558 [Aspergillus candidus]PLB38240.1 hypothetical protein BDW47DRAFT_105558 [Aspergillus candidus]